MDKKPSKIKDIQGLSRIISDATIGVTDLVQAVHKKVVHPPFLPSTPVQYLITQVAGITYNGIRTGTKLVQQGLDKLLEQVPSNITENDVSSKRERGLAILNGLVGDYLAEQDNSLAIPMQLRILGKSIYQKGIQETHSNSNGKILLLIHGSCKSDLHWSANGHNHGEALAKELGMTLVSLNYNSGLHVSTNGKELDLLMSEFVEQWIIPIKSIFILSHSMGGLVARSAIHEAKSNKQKWVTCLQKVAFLGTPHHGAPLERIGSYVHLLLKKIPYVKPFARLAKIRSAGVTDLRYGNVVDSDWEGLDRFRSHQDNRKHIPFPKDIEFYNVAATIGKEGSNWKSKLLGDGLVQVDSALGRHEVKSKDLSHDSNDSVVLFQCSHEGLLHKPEVTKYLKNWFSE
jgi:hypothetical protein